MKNKFDRLLPLIPTGKENAISQRDLCELMECKDTELRAIIQSARKEGIRILSIPGVCGYFFSDEESEILECYQMFKQRHRTTEEVLRLIDRHLKEIRRGGETHV